MNTIRAMLLLAAVGAPVVRADTVDVSASKDNTLIETPDGGLSSGLTPYFFAGRTAQGDFVDKRRAVIAFNIAGSVPAGSTINSAMLTLRMTRSQAGSVTVKLHRLLKNWGEGSSFAPTNGGAGGASAPGDATWIHTFYQNQFWTNSGGDYLATQSAAQTVGGIANYTWSSPQLAADVQSMLDNPSQNFGWIIIGDESYSQTTKRFNSRQNGSVSTRPKLTINYTLPPPTGACCLVDGSCASLTAAQCASQGGAYQGAAARCGVIECPWAPCAADVAPPGGDGTINFDDLIVLLDNWGSCPAAAGEGCPGDLAPPGGNGTIDFDDVLIVLMNWGPCK